MCRPPFEVEISPHDRIGMHGVHLIFGGWMPGIDKVTHIKEACARHELLCASALLGGASVVDHLAGNLMGLQIFFHQDRCRQRPRPQAAVTTAMSRRILFHGVLHRTSGLLAQAIQRVKLAQKPHGHTAFSVLVLSGKAGRDLR